MEWLRSQLGDTDLPGWLLQQWESALPHLLESGVVLLSAAVLYVVSRWMLRYIEHKITTRTKSEIDDHVVRLARKAASISIVLWALWRLAHAWELPAAASLVVAAWIVALSFPLSQFLADILKIVEEEIVPRTVTTLDDTALPLLNKFLRFAVIVGAVVLALAELGINITPIVAGASVAGIAVGLAAKDTLSNLIAGILLILDRPFKVGDRIELWNAPKETATWGDVVEIGLRATKIRTTDNLIFVIPNNQLMQRDIINYTASGKHIRVRIPLDIAYDADAKLAKELILKVVEGTEGILETPAPQVIIRRFGESGINLQLRVWIADGRRRRTVADEITDRVKEEFDRQGIEIPYPKRDLYIKAMPGFPEVAGAGAKGKSSSNKGSKP